MTTIGEMVAAAKGRIQNLTPEEVEKEIASGDVVLVDVREPAELTTNGAISGALNAPRGMLEFYADSSTPYYNEAFKKDARVILYCASGGRSALACAALQDLGFTNAAHLEGGFKAWSESGKPVDRRS